ncbi:HD domain-containing protein [Hoeflea poritis]|uniref:HD domain-containing protein n=1 Tax=Hoeflea poritis TaxID=2993659 RepID=A0ABT4VL76_9HYPH|nr:HD domain-containing protein [Hoeflea poritis]MDA4845451.1 HD domain-containing protein [Hoeflea poritis]
MSGSCLRKRLLKEAPHLASEANSLMSGWLAELHRQLETGDIPEFRPKQVNDPIWGTIELLPWEVALLDTPLLQRMRGVRQLGLAHLVFPGASHGRLEHIIGVVGSIEEAMRALSRQIERWNRDQPATQHIATISSRDRYALRLAALLHDIGHGPFSHALEPVLLAEDPLGGSSTQSEAVGWREDIERARETLSDEYTLNYPPSVSEIIAVFFVMSDALHKVFASDKILRDHNYSATELQDVIVAAIIGALAGPGATHLSALVSSQIDADKLDYLSRDAHHAGLEIGFDTDRLLAKLEILRVRQDNLDENLEDLRQRAAESTDQLFLQLGISASGFGSFEQMLIGRTFLYDRLYHHHKVRAAEAMAQRLILVAEKERARRFSLSEIFLSVDDDTILRILAGEVTHNQLSVSSASASTLAQDVLNRRLLHRAFAFRGRFIASPPGLSVDSADQNRRALWSRIIKDLDGLSSRFKIGEEIYETALRCCDAIEEAGNDKEKMQRFRGRLKEIGPEQIIVDLPGKKAEAIRVLARYPTGTIRVPEFSFNPVKWSDAYDLQKRTGYVFCPRDVAAIVGLASKIVFLGRYGVTMTEEADGYIKASQAPDNWIDPLKRSGLVDETMADYITNRRYSLLQLRPRDLKLPEPWLIEDPDLAVTLSNEIQKLLQGGLTAEHLTAFGKVLEVLFAFVDDWYAGPQISSELEDENALQAKLRSAFRISSLIVEEGSVLGGGKLDLAVENSILVENKFKHTAGIPEKAFPAAGMQGRRYAIALGSQVVIVVGAQRVEAGALPNKSSCVSVRPIFSGDRNRVEIRFLLPFGAPIPSREKKENPTKP